jgi:hypothetical protein
MRQEIWKTRINTTALLQEAEAEEVSVVTAATDPSAAADQLRIITAFLQRPLPTKFDKTRTRDFLELWFLTFS